MLGYYTCGVCGSKIREDKWNKHCKTNRHIKHQKKCIYAKEIFNSSMMCKIPLFCTFIPRVKNPGLTSSYNRSVK